MKRAKISLHEERVKNNNNNNETKKWEPNACYIKKKTNRREAKISHLSFLTSILPYAKNGIIISSA